MVQSILFFALGFLCAGFLAVLVAPAIWRRAVALTRRGVEASLPLTLSEIQADKDSLRAQFAMSVRKLEMTVKTFREKSAEQLVDLARAREALAALEAERAAQAQSLAAVRGESEALSAELLRSEALMRELSDKQAASERVAEEQARELERLGEMYDEASLSASQRQIELVSQEADAARLAGEISTVRGENRALARRIEEAQMQARLADAAVSAERKKAAELDRKLQRMMTTLADRDEKLDRREKELARQRQLAKAAAPARAAAPRESASRDAEIEKAIARLDGDRKQLEDRLATLARENKKLRTELSTIGQSKAGAQELEPSQATLLREQMHALAADVVHMTSGLEGPESPIRRALSQPQPRPLADDAGGARMISLAERIKALQKAAAG